MSLEVENIIDLYFRICYEQINTTRTLSHELTTINNNMLEAIRYLILTNRQDNTNTTENNTDTRSRSSFRRRNRTGENNRERQTNTRQRDETRDWNRRTTRRTNLMPSLRRNNIFNTQNTPPPPPPPSPPPPPPLTPPSILTPPPPLSSTSILQPPPVTSTNNRSRSYLDAAIRPPPLNRQRNTLSSIFETDTSNTTDFTPFFYRTPSTRTERTPLLTSTFTGRNRVFNFRNTDDILNFTMNDSPVRIRPSIRQIRRSTRILQYRDISSSQTICPINREQFTEDQSIMQIIHCGHIFDELSLRRHFRFSSRCPMCRYDIRDYEIDSLSSNENTNQTPNTTSTSSSESDNETSNVSRNISQISNEIITNLNSAVENALRTTFDNNNMTDISGGIVDLQYSVFVPPNIENELRITGEGQDISNNDISNNDISNNNLS